MDRTTVEALKQSTYRFSEEVEDLKRSLNELTTDGSGHLYDLKQIVGAESELGATISKLGGAVMNASSNAVTSLNKIVSILERKCIEQAALLESSESEYTTRIAEIESITFDSIG